MTHSTENIRAEKERIAEITKAQKAIERENKIAAKKATKLLKKSDLSSVSNNRLEEIVNSPCNPNTQDKNGWTLLAEAIVRDKAHLVEKLLKKGADLNQKATHKKTVGKRHFSIPYLKAASYGFIADLLLVKPLTFAFVLLTAPILLGSMAGAIPAAISYATVGSISTLATKIVFGSIFAITSFVQFCYWTDGNFPSDLFRSIVKHERVGFNKLKFERSIIEKSKMLPLEIAMTRQNPTIIKMIEDHQAGHNATENKTKTKKATKELAKFDFEKGTEEDFNNLIENGADINKLDKKTQNKLIETANEKNPVLAAKLKEAKNEAMNSWDKTWGTVDWKASHDEVTTKINQLVADGANVNLQNDFGATALICATNIRNTEAATALINAGANVNMQIKTGQNALMAAVLTNNVKLVETLLEAGADKTIKARTSKTALDLAYEKKNQAIIDLLQQSDKKVVAKKENKVQYIMQNDNALVRC